MASKLKKKGLKKKGGFAEKCSPKLSPKMAPKLSPKMAPKASPKTAPKAAPKASPKKATTGTNRQPKAKDAKQKHESRPEKSERPNVSAEQKEALKKQAIKAIQEGVAKKGVAHPFLPEGWSVKYRALGKYRKFVASLPELFEIKNLGGSLYDIVLRGGGAEAAPAAAEAPKLKRPPAPGTKAARKARSKAERRAAPKADKASPRAAHKQSPKLSPKAGPKASPKAAPKAPPTIMSLGFSRVRKPKKQKGKARKIGKYGSKKGGSG